MRFGLAATMALVCATPAQAGSMGDVHIARPDRDRPRADPPLRFVRGVNASAQDLERLSRKNARRKRRR